MSAHEGRSSFVSRYYQRLRNFCRRLSRPSYTTEVVFYLDDSNQQSALGALSEDALPALPTQDQLQQAGGRVLYRQRDRDEYELIIIPPGLQTQMQTSMQARLVSLSSRITETVTFINSTGHDAVVLWLSYTGDEVAYLRIKPGYSEWLQTFRNHPWIARDSLTRKRLSLHRNMRLEQMQQVAYASDGSPGGPVPYSKIIAIRDAPLVQWSQDAQKVYPPRFKTASAAFLLCHHTAGRELSNSSFRHDVCTLGDLPIELVVRIIGMAAPDVWQQSTCKHTEGRRDIRPARIPAPLTPSEQEMLRSVVQQP